MGSPQLGPSPWPVAVMAKIRRGGGRGRWGEVGKMFRNSPATDLWLGWWRKGGWQGGLRHSQAAVRLVLAAAVSNGAGGEQGGGGSTRKALGGRPFYRRSTPRQGPHDEGLAAYGLSTTSQAQHAAA
jgi:hypothetical protein